MTNAASSRRKTAAPDSSAVSANPNLVELEPSFSALSDVTQGNPGVIPLIPELDEPQQPSRSSPRSQGRYPSQPYVNPIMPLLRRLRRQTPEEIKPEEMEALQTFLQDETGDVRVNSNHLSEALTFMTGELFERYSRTALTLAIYLGKTGGTGVSATKREIARASGVVIGESDPLNGFPRYLGLRYSAQQLTEAVAFLNESYGDNGTIVPGAITAANEELRAKNEARGQRY